MLCLILQYCDQVDRVTMGSPLGPVLQIFMHHFEEKCVMNSSDRPSVCSLDTSMILLPYFATKTRLSISFIF